MSRSEELFARARLVTPGGVNSPVRAFGPVGGTPVDHRVCVVGNIDCGYILSQASVAEVRAAVKECISKAAPGGGHILSSSNSIHSSVKPENYRVMLEACHEFGTYPIRV